MQFLNNKKTLISVGVVLLFLFPIGFFIYATVVGSMFLIRSIEGKTQEKTATEVAEDTTPTRQTFFYLMKLSNSKKLSHNGEYSMLSDYENQTWNQIVETLRKEDN